MNPPLDVGKLVGAASAPVALIIATSIFLSNLGAKYGLLAGVFRELSRESRDPGEGGRVRREALDRELGLYSRRLRLLMRATFALSVGIQCFILTVLFTSVAVIFPNAKIWIWVTGFFSFAGLLILAGSVVIEMIENHWARQALLLETAEFPNTLDSGGLERGKQQFVADVQRRDAA